MEDLHIEEDKINHLTKIRSKLEQNLDEIENSLERERRMRQDVEKSKRKIEGELKIAQENIEEAIRQKHDIESAVKRFTSHSKISSIKSAN